MPTKKEDLLQLLRKDRIKELIKALEEIAASSKRQDVSDKLALLSADHSAYRRQQQLGTASPRELQTQALRFHPKANERLLLHQKTARHNQYR